MVEVKKVTGRKEENDFIRLTDMIYRDFPQYVPDLRSDVRALIRPKAAGGGQGALRFTSFVLVVDSKSSAIKRLRMNGRKESYTEYRVNK